MKARLQQIIPAKTTYKGTLYETTHYRLIELKQQKERIVEGKYIGNCGWVVFNSINGLNMFQLTLIHADRDFLWEPECCRNFMI